MERTAVRLFQAAWIGAWLFLASAGLARAEGCPGSCNGDQRVTAAELTKMVAIILECNGAPQGCDAVAGGCPPGDVDGDLVVTVVDLTSVINQILTYETGCPPPPTPVATDTPTETPLPPATDTPLPPTDTPLPTNTLPPPTATATATPTTAVVAACGNGIVDGDEECDNGGICIGSTNAGAACTAESQCPGGGVCVGGDNGETMCQGDSDCPGGTCVSCRPFGGDGCAANCTQERDLPFRLDNTVNTGSRAILNTGTLLLPLRLSGSQGLKMGKRRNGLIPIVTRAETVSLPAIRVATIACACVRGLAAKRCGGAIYEVPGTQSPDCSIVDACADLGKKPCAFIHGPGNSASGDVGCDGLPRTNLTVTQDAGGMLPIPPPPTPPPGSGPSIVTVTGAGGPGSVLSFNTTRIGQTAPPAALTNPCDARLIAPSAVEQAKLQYGPDLLFCTEDDPQSVRGNPNTVPLVTGTVTGSITRAWNGADFITVGPSMVQGSPFACEKLETAVPSTIGASLAGSFTSLNQPTLGNLVVVNVFVGAATTTPTPTPTPKP